MSSRSKAKGSAYELEVVRKHREMGVAAEKMPLSGALGGKYAGDIKLFNGGMRGECKRRKKGFTTLYKALAQDGGNDICFVRDDNQETLVVMPWETYQEFLKWSDIPQRYPAFNP